MGTKFYTGTSRVYLEEAIGNVAGTLNVLTPVKTRGSDSDLVLIEDSADSHKKKKVTAADVFALTDVTAGTQYNYSYLPEAEVNATSTPYVRNDLSVTLPTGRYIVMFSAALYTNSGSTRYADYEIWNYTGGYSQTGTGGRIAISGSDFEYPMSGWFYYDSSGVAQRYQVRWYSVSNVFNIYIKESKLLIFRLY